MSAIDTNRLETLYNRYYRLLEANQKHHYIYTDKAPRYLETLQVIKCQIQKRKNENLKRNENSDLRKFLNASSGLNGMQILMLTNPN